jgi:hypothetical protein
MVSHVEVYGEVVTVLQCHDEVVDYFAAVSRLGTPLGVKRQAMECTIGAPRDWLALCERSL